MRYKQHIITNNLSESISKFSIILYKLVYIIIINIIKLKYTFSKFEFTKLKEPTL